MGVDKNEYKSGKYLLAVFSIPDLSFFLSLILSTADKRREQKGKERKRENDKSIHTAEGGSQDNMGMGCRERG